MRKLSFLISFLLGLMSVACNNGTSSESIKFEMLEGEINKPVSFPESPYDSITLTYNIAWPISGDEQIVSYLQHWIIEGVASGSGIKNAKMDVRATLEAVADKMAATEAGELPWKKSIEVTAEENTPFNSYLTLNLQNEGYAYMAHYPDLHNATLTIRMTDGEIFQPEMAIENTDKMRALIGENLIKHYKNEDPNWEWSERIMGYNRFNVPMPRSNPQLTKEGMAIKYEMGEISSSSEGTFYCVIPYDEVRYVLSKYGQDFLSVQDEAKSDSPIKASTKASKLEEADIITLLKKANLHESEALSSEFKSLCNRFMSANETFMKYGDFPDVVMVPKPDVKLFKIIPGSDENKLTVIFDFIDTEYPHMGWISKQDYHQKICAMDLLYENDKWVVDDYYEAWSTTVDKFKKEEANSVKAYFKVCLENN